MTQQFLIIGDYDPFNLDGDVGHGCDVFMWQSGGSSTPTPEVDEHYTFDDSGGFTHDDSGGFTHEDL